jgi:NADPH-dependent 2,4-dienoyl-CoA reductase/sulfur reductase-like enzyme
MADRLVVVGGDAGGMSAASTARRRDRDLEIVAFEKGPYTSYSACGIPFYVGELVPSSEELISRSPDEHRASGIDVRTRSKVVGIDLDSRRVTVRDFDARKEFEEPFDQLVYATGGVATPPPVPGAEAVEPVRTIDAAERFRAQLDRSDDKCAVIIGGSYIGIEMAEALLGRNLKVTIVDAADQVFGSLDRDMAAHVQDGVEGEGVRVELSTKVREIKVHADGSPISVVTDDEEIPADHVVLATGVMPDVELARASGLEIDDATGAVAVDDHQRVRGADGVWAAGDCVTSWHRLLQQPVNIQLGTHANKQGRIAGVNLTGGDATFPGVIGTAVSKICRYEVARTGLSEKEAEVAGIEVAVATIKSSTRAGYYPGAGPIWVKLLAEPDTGRLLGGQIVGVEGAAKRIDVLATCVWAGLHVQEIELMDFSYAPPFSGVYDPLLVAARATAKAL